MTNSPDHRVNGVKRIRNIGERVHKSGFRGYPGLTNTALKISEYIPKCKIYCEPFAGLGRTAKHAQAEQIILNDKSPYAFDYLTKHFNAQVTNLDFEQCVKLYDGPETVFLLDPPWTYSAYAENEKTFCDRKPKAYYDRILELLSDSKSHWFVCCEHRQNLSGYENYYSIIIQAHMSKNYGFGLAKTKVYSNKPFQRHHQMTLLAQGNEK